MDLQELENYFYSLNRSLFLEGDMKKYANLDEPLSIGFGQTISQPSLVLKMIEFLVPEKEIVRSWRLVQGQVFRQLFLQKCRQKFLRWKELVN